MIEEKVQFDKCLSFRRKIAHAFQSVPHDEFDFYDKTNLYRSQMSQKQQLCCDETLSFILKDEAKKTAIEKAKNEEKLFSSRFIIIQNLHSSVSDSLLHTFFDPFGKIVEIKIGRDKFSLNPSLIASIQFENIDSANLAAQEMNHFRILGKEINIIHSFSCPIRIDDAKLAKEPINFKQNSGIQLLPDHSFSQHMKPQQLPQPTSSFPQMKPGLSAPAPPKNGPLTRIYVGSVSYDITEPELRALFAPFGNIVSMNLVPDPLTGKHKGFCFIDYDNPQSAQLAKATMNQFPLNGRNLRVNDPNLPVSYSNSSASNASIASNAGSIASISSSISSSFPSTDPSSSLIHPFPPLPPPLPIPYSSSSSSSSLPFSSTNPVIASFQAKAQAKMAEQMKMEIEREKEKEMNGNSMKEEEEEDDDEDDEDDNDEEREREREREKFEEEEEEEDDDEKAKTSNESPILCLLNLVDANKVDENLEEDVFGECQKYGDVKQVTVKQVMVKKKRKEEKKRGEKGEKGEKEKEKEKKQEENEVKEEVRVFVEFSSHEEAEAARKALDGMLFDKRKVTAYLYGFVAFLSGKFDL